MGRRGRIIAGAAIVTGMVVAAAGLVVWAIRPGPEHRIDYAKLYAKAIVRTSTEADTLARWPEPANPAQLVPGAPAPPRCYEWVAAPQAIYSLCFKNGVLVEKEIG